MRINPINNISTTNYSPVFGQNLHSPKLNFKYDDFFVSIKGYGKNVDWAKTIRDTADFAVKLIRENIDFESILRFITAGVKKANNFPTDIDKRVHTGILRTKRKNWTHGSEWNSYNLITPYDQRCKKYRTYADKLDRTVDYPLYNPYRKFKLTRPVNSGNYGKFLDHAEAKYVNRGLDMVSDLYKNLHKKYAEKDITEQDLADINSTIAEIRWILAHATPWERGSDAISNTFMRTIYKALGIKTSPLKRGISLDLEAYCTNLYEYKKNFTSYFNIKPYIVE